MAIFNKVKEIKDTKKSTVLDLDSVDLKFAAWLIDQILGDDPQKACDLLMNVYVNGVDNPQYVTDLSAAVSMYLTDHLGATKATALTTSIVIAARAAEPNEEPEQEEVKKEPEKKTKKSKK